MPIKNLKLVFFSPTGTSRKIAESMGAGINGDTIEIFDLTPPESDTTEVAFSEHDFVVFAMPVYAGRIAAEGATRLRRFKGKNTPAAVVVVYGNRAYEDALVELKTIALDSGFNPIAAGAFIGEHSFSGEKFPIATGRPDKSDLAEAKLFGGKIASKMNGDERKTIEVPGNFPYKDGLAPSKASASTDDSICTMCESCGTVCPTGAISYGSTVITDSEKCLLCCACVKTCPVRARAIAVPALLEKARWLSENCGEPKKVEIFI